MYIESEERETIGSSWTKVIVTVLFKTVKETAGRRVAKLESELLSSFSLRYGV